MRHVRTRRLRVALVLTLILLLAGVVINLLFSATPVLPVGLLLAAAALDALVLLLMRSRAASRR
jgi:hypothetical protein